MGILRIVMTGYGSQLYAGKITEQQKTEFENYCEKNSLDINEVWYENENDEMKAFFNVDDFLDMDDFLDNEGITFYDKTNFEKFLFGNKNSAEIKIYTESPLENHNKLNEIKLYVKDITFHLNKRKPFKQTKGSVLVYHGSSCNGLFDCIFPLYEDFDPTKLILNYQYWKDYGYIISSAEYDGDKDDFCFRDGEFISNFELRFE
jgi:hypothetical protein